MLTTDERRRSQRFPLGLPFEVKWRDKTAEVQKPATLRDISATGVYFEVDSSMQPESKVEFYVHLQLEGGAEPGVLLHCVGSIVRVEPTEVDTSRVGVAARIDRYRFVRPGEITVETNAAPPKH